MKYSNVKLLLFLFLVLLASSRSLRLRRRHHRTYSRLVHPVPVFDHYRPKIVGGREAVPHSIPYQAFIRIYRGSRKYRCGGSLITKEYVLTAAHCMRNMSKLPTIFLGAHNIRIDEKDRQKIDGKQIIIHEDYRAGEKHDDIALIYLEKKAILNDKVKTIPRAPSNAPDYAGSELQISGWGLTSDANTSTNVLLVAEVWGISNSECKVHYPYITNGVLCAYGKDREGPCKGDSGGPLVHIDSGLLVGVVSFGSKKGCELGIPCGFTRVSPYAKWIDDNLPGTRRKKHYN